MRKSNYVIYGSQEIKDFLDKNFPAVFLFCKLNILLFASLFVHLYLDYCVSRSVSRPSVGRWVSGQWSVGRWSVDLIKALKTS